MEDTAGKFENIVDFLWRTYHQCKRKQEQLEEECRLYAQVLTRVHKRDEQVESRDSIKSPADVECSGSTITETKLMEIEKLLEKARLLQQQEISASVEVVKSKSSKQPRMKECGIPKPADKRRVKDLVSPRVNNQNSKEPKIDMKASASSAQIHSFVPGDSKSNSALGAVPKRYSCKKSDTLTSTVKASSLKVKHVPDDTKIEPRSRSAQSASMFQKIQRLQNLALERVNEAPCDAAIQFSRNLKEDMMNDKNYHLTQDYVQLTNKIEYLYKEKEHYSNEDFKNLEKNYLKKLSELDGILEQNGSLIQDLSKDVPAILQIEQYSNSPLIWYGSGKPGNETFMEHCASTQEIKQHCEELYKLQWRNFEQDLHRQLKEFKSHLQNVPSSDNNIAYLRRSINCILHDDGQRLPALLDDENIEW